MWKKTLYSLFMVSLASAATITITYNIADANQPEIWQAVTGMQGEVMKVVLVGDSEYEVDVTLPIKEPNETPAEFVKRFNQVWFMQGIVKPHKQKQAWIARHAYASGAPSVIVDVNNNAME